MFVKLLKYDFRAMWKQFSLIWAAALVLALANRAILPNANAIFLPTMDAGVLGVISITVFMGVLLAMFIVSFVFILKRFHQGLLGDEGYLMHTLPVHTYQLVGAKLLCAVVITIVNTMVAGLSMLLMFPELTIFYDWQELVLGLINYPNIMLYFIEMLVLLLVSLAFSVSVVYLAMAVGHLFSRHRVAISVVAFFVIDIGINLCQDILTRLGLFAFFRTLNIGHMQLLGYTALLLIPTALFFFGTCYVLKNRLNLE